MEKEIKEEFDLVKDKVLEFMRDDERCRNDDKWLTIKVIRHFIEKAGGTLYISFDKLCEIPAFETIKRNRANIQNVQHRLLPTDPKVLIRRKIRQSAIREYYCSDTKIINDYETLKYGLE